MKLRRALLIAIGVCVFLIGGLATAQKAASTEPMITAVNVTFWSINDDKDKEEAVEIWIEDHTGTVYANTKVGEGQKWDEEEDGGNPTGPFTLNLTPQVPFSKSGTLKIRVKKHPHGSATGAGWSMAVAVTGRVSDGRDVNLLDRTEEARMGDGNPVERNWNFRAG